MAAGTYDLFIEQGATFRRLLTVKTNGVPVPLTGYSVQAQIRLKVADLEPVVLWDMTPDLTVTPLAGQIELYISDEDTETFTWKKAVWDLELTDPGGDVQRLLKGKVTVDLEVTRT